MYFEGEELISIAIQNLENDFRLEGKIINANLLTYILLNSIIIHIPILICLVTGDAIAGESASGTLRLILQKPFKRSQIYIAKALTGFFYSISMRKKECERCKKSFSKMYRLRYIESEKNWVFMCEPCLLNVKQNNKFYQYGGTWKG